MRLQLLQIEVFSIMQGDMSIINFFNKVRSFCHKILESFHIVNIFESIMRTITLRLNPNYRGFIITIQGWPSQPSLIMS